LKAEKFKMAAFTLSPLSKRRWKNFKANRRAYYSLLIFVFLTAIASMAEFVANDKPLIASYRGDIFFPVFSGVVTEDEFGGDEGLIAQYNDPAIQCLIITGGLTECYDDPEVIINDMDAGLITNPDILKGWIIWPIIPYSFNTINHDVVPAPGAPNEHHWLGTDDTTRDVLARVIYGFRISVAFAVVVVFVSSAIGIIAGAIMGYFGGWIDLIFQRVVEIWANIPSLYIIIIMSAIFSMSFTLLTVLVALFSWTALVGVVRAEFLRARNFEYVRAARALGLSNFKIIFRHVLPNAMVATVTMLPFLFTGAIGALTSLDFLGFGLPPSYPSLGELALQAKQNLHAPWLAFTAFFVISAMLSLLVFIFEGVRDAFDPRKTFS
jgi:microcin C transport system permease protein